MIRRSAEREQFLLDLLTTAVEHNGYGFFDVDEYVWDRPPSEVFADISEEVEELPPPNGPAAPSPSSGSGSYSSTTGAPPPAASPPNGSGSPGSATGATSDPRTSAA